MRKKSLVFLVLLISMILTVSAADIDLKEEDGDISEYAGDTGDYAAVQSPVNDGSYSIEKSGSSNSLMVLDGLGGLNPDTVRFAVRSGEVADQTHIRFRDSSGNRVIAAGIREGNFQVFNGANSFSTQSADNDKWYNLELRFYWGSDQASLYFTNGTQLVGNTSFENSASSYSQYRLVVTDVDSDGYNGQAYFDSVPQQPPSLSSSLKTWLRLNESSSPSTDYSNYSNDAVWIGSPISDQTGVSKSEGDWGDGESIELDPAQDSTADYLEVSDSSSLDVGGKNVTISVWGSYASDSTFRYIAGHGDTGGDHWLIRKESDNTISARFGDGTDVPEVKSSNTYSGSSLHHYVLVLDRSTDSIELFIDGSSVGTADASSLDDPLSISTNLTLGNYPNPESAADPLSNQWDGRIDEFKYYIGEAATDTQVSNLNQYNELSDPTSSTAVGIDSVESPVGGETYVDSRIELNVSLNATGDLKYNFDGNSNTTVSSVSSYTHNITGFSELSSGSHTLNLYTNNDSQSISFNYEKGEVSIPEDPYGVDYQYVTNYDDMSTESTEFSEVTQFVDNVTSETGLNGSDWNGPRFTLNLMPDWLSDQHINDSSVNTQLISQYQNYSMECMDSGSKGIISYNYHTQEDDTQSNQKTGTYGSKTQTRNQMDLALGQYDDFVGQSGCGERPDAHIGGWGNYDYWTYVSLAERGIHIDHSPNADRYGSDAGSLGDAPINETFFYSSLDTTDYTSTDFLTVDGGQGTRNWYERQDGIEVVTIPDSNPPGTSFTQNSADTIISNVDSMLQTDSDYATTGGHMDHSLTTSFDFPPEKMAEVYQWYYNDYVSNSSRDARWSTKEEMGGQFLGNQTVQVSQEWSNSSGTLYNLSSDIEVPWMSVGLNKSVFQYNDRRVWASYDDGGTWTELDLKKETSDKVFVQTHMSSTLLKANSTEEEDTTPPDLTIYSPENMTYSSSDVDLNVTSTEPANFTYNNGAGNVTVNEDDTDLNETLSGLSQGQYTLDVWASDAAGNTGFESVSYTISTDPQAEFTANSTTLDIDETVEFDASGSTDDGSISSYDWTFGDSNTGTGQVVTHSYGSTGTYTVELTVTDNDGNTDTATQSIDVINKSSTKGGLVEECPATPFCYSGNSSNPETINGSFTQENESQVFTWTVNATGSPGQYEFFGFFNSTVSRISETLSGKTNITISSISEQNDPPTADFSVDASNLSVGVDASASTDSDGSIAAYRWDWTSDGNYESTGQTSSHTYPSEGEYDITLEVEDNDGATDTLVKTVSLTEQTDGGGSDGGEEPSPPDEPEVTVDGSSLQLLAPHRGTRYGEQSLQVSENESKTFFFYNEEHTIEVLDVEDSQNAEIVVDGIQKEVTERDSFELERGTSAPYNIIEDVSVADIVDANNSKEVYFSVAGEPNPDVETPIGYQYQINESGMITLQYRRTGIDEDWVNATEQTFTESVEQNYTTFYQNLSSGIYEVRGILESNGNSSTTRATGVYIGEVPYLNITNPEPGRVFTEVSNGAGGYTIPINFRAGTVNQTKFSLYYTDGSNIYAGATNVQITDDSDIVESFFESLGNLDYIADWFSYEWQNVDVIAPTDVTFTGSADVTVPTTGGYTGYVNASSNYSEVFEPWNATSIGVPVTVETTSVEDVPDSEVIDTFDPEDGDIARPPGSDENFSEDVNGSNFTNPQWRLVSPDQNAEIESARLDELSVEFDMLMGYEGTAAVNKTLTVENPSGEQVNINLNPSDSSYNDISVSAAKWQADEWSQGEYDWWLNYEFNDSIVYSTENKTNGEASFTVDRKRGPLESIRYFFDQLAETFADQLNTTKVLAATSLVMLMVIPTYVTVRYLVGDEIVAFLAAATVYSALAWVKLAPETLNFIILLIGLFYVVGKFTLWVVGSG